MNDLKIMTILGTRPEIIRLSKIIPILDNNFDNIFVHTGQNFDKNLKDIFFDQMNIRKPDFYLDIHSESPGDQIGKIISKSEELFKKLRPNLLLILGDVNSGLSSIIAERMGIQTIHLEAGNRCYDTKVPEEINRRIIDHVCSWNLPYTEKSKQNLLREGIENSKIFVSGNPIYEVIYNYQKEWNNSNILKDLNLEKENYFLVTAHRTENVNDENKLRSIFESLKQISIDYEIPIVISVHPRTKSMIKNFNINIIDKNFLLSEPFGFFEFLKLEKNAKCVITDSGTVQEECSIFKVPTVTIRNTTERPETVEAGSNIISGLEKRRIVRSVKIMCESDRDWNIPDGYDDKNVSKKILNFVQGINI